MRNKHTEAAKEETLLLLSTLILIEW